MRTALDALSKSFRNAEQAAPAADIDVLALIDFRDDGAVLSPHSGHVVLPSLDLADNRGTTPPKR
jgi:hypothetical protein